MKARCFCQLFIVSMLQSMLTTTVVIAVDYYEDTGPGDLVRYGKFCFNKTGFDVDGPPQLGPKPFSLKVYEIPDPNSANTLHLVIQPKNNQAYQYMMMMALNEKGIPTGHFHHFPCADAKKDVSSGVNRVKNNCTEKDKGVGKKWGTTRLMYTVPRPTKETPLRDVSVFWSWMPDDGPAPKKIQFRYACIHPIKNEHDMYWVDMLSPVIDFTVTPRANATRKSQRMTCYDRELTTDSTGNFIISKNQKELEVNMEFLYDVFPDLVLPPPLTEKSSVMTTSMATTTPTLSTNTHKHRDPKIILGSYAPSKLKLVDTNPKQSANTDEAPERASTLVRYGLFCENIKEFEVDGIPQTGPPPFELSLYQVLGKNSPNIIQLVVKPKNFRYKYLIVEAVGETGLPVGHFLHVACLDPRPAGKGRHHVMEICTQDNMGHGLKYGKTSFMYSVPNKDRGQKELGEEGVFWTWVRNHAVFKGDGTIPPKRIQFRAAAVQEVVDREDIFYVNILSPVIDFSYKSIREETSPEDFEAAHCYQEPVTATSRGNFKISSNQNPIPVNMEYLYDLFPDLISPTTTVLSTELSTSLVDTMATAATEASREPSSSPTLNQTITTSIAVPNGETRTGRPAPNTEEEEEYDSPGSRFHLIGSALKASYEPDVTTTGASVGLHSTGEGGVTQVNSIEKGETPRGDQQVPSTPAQGHEKPERTEEDDLSWDPTYYDVRPRLPDAEPSLGLLDSMCDVGTGCVGSVPGCMSSKCRIMVTFTPISDKGYGYYRFTLLGEVPSGSGYVAVGLSLDRQMGGDSVVECVVESSGKMGVFMSWNLVHGNTRLAGAPCDSTHPQYGPISGCNITVEDGKLLCNFYRRAVTKIHGQVFDLDRTKYFILEAIGHDIKGNYVADANGKIVSVGNIGTHVFSFATVRALALRAGTDEEETDLRRVIYIKIHAVCMIIAWIVLVPNAQFIIRYMKETWSDVTFFGHPYYVFIHTTVMCLAGSFITAALVMGVWYTFVEHGYVAFQMEEFVHTILGSIAVILFCIQFFLGGIRPALGKGRTVVNVVHFFTGTICYVTAVILILRAHKMTTSYFPCSSSILMILWIIWSGCCHIITSVQIFRRDKEEKLETFRAFLPLPFVIKTEELPGQRFRLNVFAFHAAGACIVSTILILPYLEVTRGCTCREEVCFQYSAT